MDTLNYFDNLKKYLKDHIKTSQDINLPNTIWLKSLKKSLCLIQQLNIPNRNRSFLESRLNRIKETFISEPDFEKYKTETFKLILNICMSLFEVSIQEFNYLYSSCINSSNSSNSSDFFSLLSEALYLKIQSTLKNDFADKRLKDYLTEIFTRFGLKDLNFLMSVVNCELDPERSPDTPDNKTKTVIQMIFGSSKSYKFYLKGSSFLSKLYAQVQSEDSKELNVKATYYLNMNQKKEWKLCQFGLDAENSRFDKIVTIGGNTLSDICVEGMKNITCGIIYTGYKLCIVNFNERIKFTVKANQNIFIENGAKLWFGEIDYVEFVDSSVFYVNDDGNKFEFEEREENGYTVKILKVIMNGIEIEVKVLKFNSRFLLYNLCRDFLYEYGNGDYKPIFLSYLNRENQELELDESEILISNWRFKFKREYN